MKALFLSCGYISGVQTGLQAGHVMDSMWSKYTNRILNPDLTVSERCTAADRRKLWMLREFAMDHKTFVILNGGDHEALIDYITFLNNVDNPYPWAFVSEPGLNHAVTSVGCILPGRMFGKVAERTGQLWLQYGNQQALSDAGKSLPLPEDGDGGWTEFQLELLKRKAMCGKAT